MTESGIVVRVDDNARYMDTDARWTLGVFATVEEAEIAAKALVDRCLEEQFTAGMSAAQLFAQYQAFGDDPFFASGAGDASFSAWTYAKARSEEIAAEGTIAEPP